MAKAQILVVEDDNIVVMELRDRLQSLGYAVSVVASYGEEAVEKAGETRPDLVLMDIRLKGDMDGIEAAEEIRGSFDIPVVYLTAYVDENTLRRAKVTEPYGYISKPFEERELRTNIEIALYKHKMERKLKESERWLATTLTSIGDAVIATDEKGLVTFVNPVAEALTGWKQEDALGEGVTEVFNIIDGETGTVTESAVTRAIGEGVVLSPTNNTILIAKNGTEIPIDDSAAPIRDDKGDIAGAVLVFRDITERKRAEEALKASQEYVRNIIDSSLDMIIAVDMDRHIVEFNKAGQDTFGYRPEEVLGIQADILYIDPQQALIVHETTVKKGQCVREVFNRRKNGEIFPAFLSASVLRDVRGEVVGVMGVSRDISDRKRVEEALGRRNRELALLNRAGQVFNSTLDLDQVLVTVLEEVRRLLNVVACSVWLTGPEMDELICRQAVGPQSEIVRGWRLAPGEGIAGWVARSGDSLIVPDTRTDERHFKGVDQQTGLDLHSILAVPLRVKQDVIGVLEVVDTEVVRFGTRDLALVESLAATAAIAIENARLYEQARQDAETRAVLLREVNHRVQNNLTAIIGFLYAARRRAGMEDQAAYQSIMQDLVNRVQGLSTVHSLFSASRWVPLPLSKLTSRVINSSLQMLPRGKRVSVDVSPSPVRVTPDEAHNLALVINELATNTVKHALQERDTGHITVRVALEDDTVLFEFRDDGPGYPEEVLQLERRDVGLDLIQNIVRKGLRGELSLHNDHGAVAVIQFKAKA